MSYSVGDQPIPGYVLREFLGSGGIGSVWRAHAPGGTRCAIKIIGNLQDRGGRKEFDSLQLVKNIGHPNLVPIFGFWLKNTSGQLIALTPKDADDSSVDVRAEKWAKSIDRIDELRATDAASAATSEPLDDDDHRKTDNSARRTEIAPSGSKVGGRPSKRRNDKDPAELIIAMGLGKQNLYERMLECKADGLPGIPTDELLAYMQGTADAIDSLNRAGVQHCDIKPQNILNVGGKAQVCDFGLAQAIGDDVRSTSKPSFSPAYADPRVQNGESPNDATDLYCLAATYVELRTGDLPFPTDSYAGLLRAKEQGDLYLTPLTAAEQSVVRRALAARPEDRGYKRCVDFVEAVRLALQERPRTVRTASWFQIKSWLPIAVIGIACLIWITLPTDKSNQREAKELVASANAETFDVKLSNALAFAKRIRNDVKRKETQDVVVNTWMDFIATAADRSSKLQSLKDLLVLSPDLTAPRQAQKALLQETIDESLGHVRENGNLAAAAEQCDDVLEIVVNSPHPSSNELIDQLWMLRLYAGHKAKLPLNANQRAQLAARFQREQVDTNDGGNVLGVYSEAVRATGSVIHHVLKTSPREFCLLRDIGPDRGRLAPAARIIYDDLVEMIVEEYADQKMTLDPLTLETIDQLATGPEFAKAKIRALVRELRVDEAVTLIPDVLETDQSLLSIAMPIATGTLAPNELKRRVALLDPRDIDRRLAAYVPRDSVLSSFLMALVEHVAPQPGRLAAGEYARQAMEREKTTSHVMGAARREQLVEVLVSAASQLKSGASGTFDVPYASTEKAERALGYLQAAQRATDGLPDIAQLNEVLADEVTVAIYYASNDRERLEDVLTRSASTARSDVQRVPTEVDAVVHAAGIQRLTESPDQPQIATAVVAATARLIQNWEDRMRRDEVNRNEYLEQVLQLFTTYVEAVIPFLNSDLQTVDTRAPDPQAKILAFYGTAIQNDYQLQRRLERAGKNYQSVAITALEKSITSPRPASLVSLAYALDRWQLAASPQSTIDRMEQLASQAWDLCRAETAHPALADVMNLSGYVDLLKSRQQRQPEQAAAHLDDAIRKFSAARQRSGARINPSILVNLSTSLVERAFAHTKSSRASCELARESLHAAIRYADEAVSRVEDHRLDTISGWMTRGNAYEDLAHYRLGQDTNFDTAINCFQQAVSSSMRPHYSRSGSGTRDARISLGRCLYRRAMREQENGVARRKVVQSFDLAIEALKADGTSMDSQDSARRELWLGSCYAALGKREFAVSHLSRAAAAARVYDPPRWVQYQVPYCRQLSKTQAITASEEILATFYSSEAAKYQVLPTELAAAIQIATDNIEAKAVSNWLDAHRDRRLPPEAQMQVVLSELRAMNTLAINTLADVDVPRVLELDRRFDRLKVEATTTWNRDYERDYLVGFLLAMKANFRRDLVEDAKSRLRSAAESTAHSITSDPKRCGQQVDQQELQQSVHFEAVTSLATVLVNIQDHGTREETTQTLAWLKAIEQALNVERFTNTDGHGVAELIEKLEAF